MQPVTKGLRCPCGYEQNVTVSKALLGMFCPKCNAWVMLGEALGLSFGQAVVATLVILWLIG